MTDWGSIGDLSGDPTGPGWSGRQVDPGITSTGKQMDPAMKRFMMNMVGAGIMGDPKLRKILQGVLFARNPSKQGAQMAQRAGIMGLLKKFGPSALYALTNRGGAFGLGTGGPLGQGVLDSFSRNPLGTMGRLKYAATNPLLGLLMAGLNKFSPAIEGQKGPLGGATGPQFANLASKILGTRSTEQAMKEFGPGILGGTLGPRIRNALGIGQRSAPQATGDLGTGILGGTLGPRIRNALGIGQRSPSIEEIQITAQKRPPRIEGQTSEAAVGTDPWSTYTGYIPSPSLAQYTSGWTPGQGKK